MMASVPMAPVRTRSAAPLSFSGLTAMTLNFVSRYELTTVSSVRASKPGHMPSARSSDTMRGTAWTVFSRPSCRRMMPSGRTWSARSTMTSTGGRCQSKVSVVQ